MRATPLVLVLSIAATCAIPAARISVHSDAIGSDGRFAAHNSAYGADISPEVSWIAVPGAKSYSIVLDDPDAPGAGPFQFGNDDAHE